MVNRTEPTLIYYSNGKAIRTLNKRIFMVQKKEGDKTFFNVTVWKKIEGDSVDISAAGWLKLRQNFYVRTYFISEQTMLEMIILYNEFEKDRIIQQGPAKLTNEPGKDENSKFTKPSN
jgi:hypothetical protein